MDIITTLFTYQGQILPASQAHLSMTAKYGSRRGTGSIGGAIRWGFLRYTIRGNIVYLERMR